MGSPGDTSSFGDLATEAANLERMIKKQLTLRQDLRQTCALSSIHPPAQRLYGGAASLTIIPRLQWRLRLLVEENDIMNRRINANSNPRLLTRLPYEKIWYGCHPSWRRHNLSNEYQTYYRSPREERQYLETVIGDSLFHRQEIREACILVGIRVPSQRVVLCTNNSPILPKLMLRLSLLEGEIEFMESRYERHVIQGIPDGPPGSPQDDDFEWEFVFNRQGENPIVPSTPEVRTWLCPRPT